MLNETLRYHSSVINIKQVQHDITLGDQYLLKKNAIVMILGQSIHHDKDIWGSAADVCDHHRFLSYEHKTDMSSSSAFILFGAGVTMCPGRHFSTIVILSLVAVVVLQYEVVLEKTQYTLLTKRNADLWNAMPDPDLDLNVTFKRRVQEEAEWKFVWGDEVESI
jgi:cytochrome P450